MERPGDAANSGRSASSDQAWFGEYLARATDYWQRTARGTGVLASKFGDRSIQENDWTIDTVTADVIEAWEELTPLLGEGIELWLEIVQRGLKAGRPDG
jgi:hypothetical protein